MNVARFARSVAHTRTSQLLERLRRIARTRFHDLLPSWTDWRCRGPRLEIRAPLPKPLFEPRAERVVPGRDGPSASFLNTSHSLHVPIDWRATGRPELERMNLHYMEFLEPLDDAAFAAVVADWIANNPIDARGAWRIGWNSYVLALRVVVWMQQLAQRRGDLDSELVQRIETSLCEQVRFLARALERDIGGNHLIKDAKALLWASRYFDGRETRRWGALAQRILRKELVEQVLADGVHYERSPAYHAQVFADLLECAHIAEGPLRGKLLARLEPMAQALLDLTHTDGLPSQFNDGGLHMSYSTDACLAAWSAMCADTNAKAPAPRAVFSLSEAGYFGARSGCTYLLVDCGHIAPEHLPAHGHGDALAFEWTVEGLRFIVDAGVYEYERGAARDASRSTRLHNTVTLDDRDQCEFWAAFRVGRRAHARLERFEPMGRGFVLEGSHDGYAHLPGHPIHSRRFVVAPSSLVVDDTITGGRRQVVRARLLLHPEVEAITANRHGLTLRRGDVAVLIEARHPITVVDATWSPDFGVVVPTKQLVIHYPPAPCRGSFRMQHVPVATLERVRNWAAFVHRVAPG